MSAYKRDGMGSLRSIEDELANEPDVWLYMNFEILVGTRLDRRLTMILSSNVRDKYPSSICFENDLLPIQHVHSVPPIHVTWSRRSHMNVHNQSSTFDLPFIVTFDLQTMWA
jgi:hypothetical protein